jgi:hypothetical protein
MIWKKPALGLDPRVQAGFPKRSRSNKSIERDDDSKESHPAPGEFGFGKRHPDRRRQIKAVSMTLIGRRILRCGRPLILRRPMHRMLGKMTAGQASGGRPQPSVVAGIVSGNTADDGSFDAPFRVRGHRGRRQGERQCQSREDHFHVSRLRPFCQSAPKGSVPAGNVVGACD